jgi:hypothetical protein
MLRIVAIVYGENTSYALGYLSLLRALVQFELLGDSSSQARESTWSFNVLLLRFISDWLKLTAPDSAM